LQLWSFFCENCPFYRANLETDATVDASGKVNPVPISSLGVFAWAIMNTSYWTGIYAVSNAFTDFCNNCMRHVLDSLSSVSAISSLAGEWGLGIGDTGVKVSLDDTAISIHY
jgi:hypothetical protein